MIAKVHRFRISMQATFHFVKTNSKPSACPCINVLAPHTIWVYDQANQRNTYQCCKYIQPKHGYRIVRKTPRAVNIFKRMVMVNLILLSSSLTCSIVHVVATVFFQPNLKTTIISVIGCSVAIWNHGTTNAVAKTVDRIVASTCLVIMAYDAVSVHPMLTGGYVSSATLYGLAKLKRKTWPHVVTHLLSTMCNIILMSS